MAFSCYEILVLDVFFSKLNILSWFNFSDDCIIYSGIKYLLHKYQSYHIVIPELSHSYHIVIPEMLMVLRNNPWNQVYILLLYQILVWYVYTKTLTDQGITNSCGVKWIFLYFTSLNELPVFQFYFLNFLPFSWPTWLTV